MMLRAMIALPSVLIALLFLASIVSAINVCFPQAYLTDLFLQNAAERNFLEATNAVDYHLLKQRLRLNAGIANGQNISSPVDVFEDYTTRTVWIALAAAKYCKSHSMEESSSLVQCFEAKELAPVAFAGKTPGNLFGVTDPKDNVPYVFGLDAVDNSLVFLSNPNTTISYFNSAVGPVDPGLFVPPTYCGTTVTIQPPADEIDLLMDAVWNLVSHRGRAFRL